MSKMTKQRDRDDEKDKSRMRRQWEFAREIDKEKFIKRQTYKSDGITRENDAEHAWHAAVMTLLMSEYSNCEINVLRTMSMLLIHDLVEIDAGDTYAYDEEGKKTQRSREEKAAERIFGILPGDQRKYFRDLWEEFEEGKTPEAKFAHVMDNLQPMMLNAASDGKGWIEHQTRLGQILERNRPTPEGSHGLWEYACENFLKPNLEKGHIKGDVPLSPEEERDQSKMEM